MVTQQDGTHVPPPRLKDHDENPTAMAMKAFAKAEATLCRWIHQNSSRLHSAMDAAWTGRAYGVMEEIRIADSELDALYALLRRVRCMRRLVTMIDYLR